MSDLPVKVHDELIKTQMQDRLVGHISRDSTAIEVNGKPAPSKKKSPRHLKNPVAPDAAKSVHQPRQVDLNLS